MSSSLRKVSLLILAIIVLPVLIFSVFEIGNLRQNEKVIQNIYKNQLDAILYSINEYSDDIVSNLASRIENSLNNYKTDNGLEVNRIITEMPSVKNLIQFNKKLEYSGDTVIIDKQNLFTIDGRPIPSPDNTSITLYYHKLPGNKTIRDIHGKRIPENYCN